MPAETRLFKFYIQSDKLVVRDGPYKDRDIDEICEQERWTPLDFTFEPGFFGYYVVMRREKPGETIPTQFLG